MQGVQTDHPPGGVCIVTGELTRYCQSMRSLVGLQVPPGSAMPWVAGVLVARNINECLRTVIGDPSLQWAWLMGDDHTFRPDILLRLLDRNVDAIVPMCLNKHPPFDPTIQIHGAGGRRLKPLQDMPAGGLYRLAGNETCGDAGLLLRRHVLERIAPGGDWYDRKKSGAHDAEDQEFIARIKAGGYDVHVDCDHVIGHIAPAEFVPIRKDGGWEVRITAGQKHVADLAPL